MRSSLDTMFRHGLAQVFLARFNAPFGRFVLSAAKANCRIEQGLFGRGSRVLRIPLGQTSTCCNRLAQIIGGVRDGTLDSFWGGAFVETDDGLEDKLFGHII